LLKETKNKKMQTKSPESHSSSLNKKGGYMVPTESKKERDEAKTRFVNALNQVTCSVMAV
jgi:hypothetical protein